MKDYFKQKEFLAKINCGDEEAYLAVYRYFAPKLFRHFYYRLHHKQTAEDMAQQVFCRTWEFIAKGEPIEEISGFLYRVANNLCIDYYRKSERKDRFISEDDEKELAADTSNTNELEGDLDGKFLRKVLAQLGDDKRQLLVWRYLDDLSISEIARILKKPNNAIYVALHRAVKELKAIAQKYESD